MNPSPYPRPFNSAHVRARIVKILLVAGAIVTGLSIFFEALTLAFPPLSEDQELAENPFGAVLVLFVFLFAVLSVLIYIATVVVFLMWLYRASDNLRAFNPWARPEYSPGWAVGWFFIPFANLFMPFRVVKEVWQKSGPPDEDFIVAPSLPATFIVWWVFWLLASFSGNISMRLSFNENVDQSTATIVSIVAGTLSIIAALFAYLVVDAIDDKQEETARKIKLGNFAEPPPPPSNLQMPDTLAPAP